jgi:transcriptional regulator with XRE-family HTH domain
MIFGHNQEREYCKENAENLRCGERLLLGKRIRALRKVREWTQEQLGKHAELSYKFIGEIERGQQNPSFDTFIKIAAALKVDLTELFRFERIVTDKKDAEEQICRIVKTMSGEDITRLLAILKVLYRQP